jgi:hypothetical protein
MSRVCCCASDKIFIYSIAHLHIYDIPIRELDPGCHILDRLQENVLKCAVRMVLSVKDI